jgi:hypothetical protein
MYFQHIMGTKFAILVISCECAELYFHKVACSMYNIPLKMFQMDSNY